MDYPIATTNRCRKSLLGGIKRDPFGYFQIWTEGGKEGPRPSRGWDRRAEVKSLERVERKGSKLENAGIERIIAKAVQGWGLVLNHPTEASREEYVDMYCNGENRQGRKVSL